MPVVACLAACASTEGTETGTTTTTDSTVAAGTSASGTSPTGTSVGASSAGSSHGATTSGAGCPTAIRIASGQTTSVTDGNGSVWQADADFSGGTAQVTPGQAVAGTNSPTLYDGQRYGSSGNGFSYTFDSLAPGSYTVTLKFAENYFASAGQRVFDVAINGSAVLSNFDIFAAAGGQWIAIDRSFPATVGSAGTLAIAFAVGAANNPKVDAIEIDCGATTATGTSTGSTLGSTGASSSSSSSSSASTSSSTSTGGPPPAGTISVDTRSNLATISPRALGTNLGVGSDLTDPRIAAGVGAVGAKTVRYPGGSWSDGYHWQTNSMCNPPGLPVNAHGGFDDFMTNIVVPGGLEAVITVDYGTNVACNGGADPSEAAAWVAYAKSNNYNAHYWTVGNEVYGSWEADMHSSPHNGGTYAAAVSGPSGFYRQMKNADPTAQVGVVLYPGPGDYNGWNAAVLGAKPPLDFVEIHPYPQCDNDSDSFLLKSAPASLTAAIAGTRSTLTKYGYPASTPIMIGELANDGCVANQQSVSIVGGLYAGMAYGELLNEGVEIATWLAAGSGNNWKLCNTGSGLYGWQGFGDWESVAIISPIPNCGNGPDVPAGTIFPTGQAQALRSLFAQAGGTMLKASLGSGLSNVRAYAATQGTGYALMLFNLDENTSTTVAVALNNATRTSFSGTTSTYDKAVYDLSKQNMWPGPNDGTLGTVGSNFNVTLSPWSMTVVLLQ